MKGKIYNEGKEAKCLDDTPPAVIDQSVGERNDDNNEDNGEGKVAECLDDTYPDEMEEDGSDKKTKRMQRNMRKKRMPRGHFP